MIIVMKNLLLLSALVVVSCTQKKSLSNETENKVTDSLSVMNTRTIKATDLKTGSEYSTPVISNAQKFIIPVPSFKDGGEPLIYPKDQPRAGEPILDYQGKPIGKKGIVFFNFKDQTVQAAAGDGKSVIIINEVTKEQAEKLYKEIAKLHADPNDLTLIELKQIITFANKKLDLSDMYNSTRSFIKEKMTPVDAEDRSKDKNTDEAYGLKKRDDRDINQAIYIPGAFIFEGPAASPQKFKDGGVIVEQNGKMRGVQPDIFFRTYQLADGKPVKSVNDLKSQMEQAAP